MSLAQWLLLVVICVPLALVIMNRLRMDLAALMMAALLGVLQFLGVGILGLAHAPQDAIKSRFGSEPASRRYVASPVHHDPRSGQERRHTLLARTSSNWVGAASGASSPLYGHHSISILFMNNLAAGALVLPSAMEVARRTGVKPSKLLIPVAYGSLLGGSATYFTTANIAVSDLLRIANPPQAPLHILDFTPTGGLIAIAGILFLAFFGKRLLPDHEPTAEQALARLTGSELEDLYQLGERLWEAHVAPESP